MKTPARKIVVGVDYEELGEAALRTAFALASSAGSTEVHPVHVRSPLEGFPISGRTVAKIDNDLETLRTYVGEILGDWLEEHDDAVIPEVSAHVTNGRPAEALVRVAAGLRAGLIVVGTHGRRGLSRAILGSVAGAVVEKATCPVLVVRGITHEVAEPIADIEPVCGECLARRAESSGSELWCERHAERHPRAHVYAYSGPSSQPVRPWGF
jgi:nucleotide-binding universal stress UspA family protein